LTVYVCTSHLGIQYAQSIQAAVISLERLVDTVAVGKSSFTIKRWHNHYDSSYISICIKIQSI